MIRIIMFLNPNYVTSVNQMVILYRLAEARYLPSGANERQNTESKCPRRVFSIFVSSFSKGFQMQIDPSKHPLEKKKTNNGVTKSSVIMQMLSIIKTSNTVLLNGSSGVSALTGLKCL
jgi:hypothetical protein